MYSGAFIEFRRAGLQAWLAAGGSGRGKWGVLLAGEADAAGAQFLPFLAI